MEIKEYTVHPRQRLLDFDSFNCIFDGQPYVIYSYINSLIFGDNRLLSFSNDLECSSKVTVSFRQLLGKQCLL